MVVTDVRTSLARVQNYAASNAGVLGIFTATIFLSALLLFSVQPVFAKMVLPKLGGAPSVWAVSMCFFQAVLLAGYCYAHALNRFAAPKIAPLIHLGVLAVAYLALPFGLPANAEPPPGDAYLWLIGVLFLGVGLPFFAVSANAPLLQSWFAKSGHPHAADPYFLYGASNLGSLLALLAYPVIIEPWLGLSTQANVWTGGFVLLALMISGSALAMLAAARSNGVAWSANVEMVAVGIVPVTATDRAWWIWLSFVPSGLLVAFTSHLTTDVASAPFLWVLPLAVFLATFIVVFRQGWALHGVLKICQPALVGGALIGLTAVGGTSGWIFMVAGATGFVVTTLVCHRELFLRRPSARHLTEFYLWMSLGGVLGGVFAALIAPQLFSTVLEYPLLLVLGLLTSPSLLSDLKREPRSHLLRGALAVVALLICGIGVAMLLPSIEEKGKTVVQLVLFVGIVLWWRMPHRGLVLAAASGLAIAVVPTGGGNVIIERSFFGVHRVAELLGGQFRVIQHGTTLHGAQRLKTPRGEPVIRPVPATYYHAGSPMAKGVEIARGLKAGTGQPLRVGIVGLGAGSLACYSQPHETWKFYEIDPVVAKIARDGTLFSFLSTCRPAADIILGDARLTLAKVAEGAFDYLVIDAFASDSIPVHLLTREALAMYVSRLSPDGLLALHVSNRHMDLETVAAATARSLGVAVVAIFDRPEGGEGYDASASNVVLVSRSEAVLAEALKRPGARRVDGRGVAPWSDDYSDVVGAILRRARGH